MTQKEISDIYARTAALIGRSRLGDAFGLLTNTAEASMQWEISDRVKQIEQNYRYMLSYLTDGMDDPERDHVLDSIVCDTWTALDILVRRLHLRENPSLYFGTLRSLGSQRVTLARRIEDLRALAPDSIVERLTAGVSAEATESQRRESERIENDIFNHIWVTFPMSSDNVALLKDVVADENFPVTFRANVISAISLGLLEVFDGARLELLLEIYAGAEADVMLRCRAMTGALLALFKYRNRPLPRNVTDTLAVVRELPEWSSDLRTIFIEMIQARNTERITRTMREEIIPGMMNLKPDIVEKMTRSEITPDAVEANPDWEDLLHKSGVADQLRRLSEIQEQGGDVFMATFAGMKGFGFFNTLSHWFIPFDTSRMAVEAERLPVELLHTFENMPHLCDNDKYSLVFGMSMLPEAQRKMLLNQLEQSRELLEEMFERSALDSNNHADVRLVATSYLRDLYRFNNLFRRKGEFYNPFRDGVNLMTVPALEADFKDGSLVRVVAEFLFKLEYWKDAARTFALLDTLEGPDPAVFEKLAYSYHSLKDYARAVDYYHEAEAFHPQSKWLLNRLAEVYTALGNHGEAARYLERLAETEPENIDVTLQLGSAYLHQDLYQRALDQFYKAEFLDNSSARTLRPLAWTLFLMGKPEDSARYYGRIATEDLSGEDIVRMGHLEMARGKYGRAIERYASALGHGYKDIEDLISAIRSGRDVLVSAGVPVRTITLIIDALLYRVKR